MAVNSAGAVRASATRMVGRPLAALALGALLFGAWAGLAGLVMTRAAGQAGQQTILTAQGIAGRIDAGFARFADQVLAATPADFAPGDRVGETARLLRLQNLLPGATATFMLAPDGHLLAASAPFLPADAKVGGTAWFGTALAAPPNQIAVQALDHPWFAINSGLVLTRTVAGPTGAPVGLLGVVMPAIELTQVSAPGWLQPGVSVLVLGGTNGTVLTGAPPEQTPLPWPTQAMQAVLGWSGVTANWSASVPLHVFNATVIATMTPAAALPAELGRPILAAGAGTLLAWLLAVFAIFRRPREAGVPAQEGFSSDWHCALDSEGRIRELHGLVPGALAAAHTLPLAAALGLPSDSDCADQISDALRQRATTVLRIELAGRIYQVTLAPTPPDDFVCSGRDVSEQVAAIAERDAAEAAVAEARRDQDRLLTSLGHDFRTPMTSIMGICELLLDDTLEEEQRTWLERMHGSCGALLGMLNGLLEVAGDEVGRAMLLREPVEVTALLQEVADMLRPQARDKGLELRIRCDDLLRGQWLLDSGRLRQVVFNLASNAVKFTPSGRVEIRASAVDAEGQTRLRIAVSDTGPGIDPGEREQIFERFRRGRAQEDSGHGGLGLGLALCRDNAALMGGSLTLESALGVGSEFTFECPAERVPVHDRLLPFAGRTALIVADDVPATRALAGQLGELGLMVETAPDGYLGLAVAERLEAQRGAVDLVVLQGSLPGMAGEVFVRRLRSTPFGRRAVLLWIGNEADAAAVDASLPSPPDPYQVAAVARQLLAERPSLEALEPNASLSRGGRVLLVEDDKANQALLAAALTRRGFAVFTAGNGEEAVRMAGRDSFDAILMDLQMPGLDGFEATRRIRALPGHAGSVPIAALTALQGARLRQRCTETGFTAVLEKPVNMERLTTCLQHWVADPGSPSPVALDRSAYVADVSVAFLEEMVAVVGLERARACVAEFVAGATARCRRLGELLPGWEVGAILRSCEEISGMAETCGALALGELLEEIADAATRDDREAAEGMIARLDTVIARLPHAMAACLDDVAQRWSRDSKAA